MNATVAAPLCCAATPQLYLLVYRRVVIRDTSVCYQISTPYNYYLNNSQIQNLNTVALPPAYRIQLFHTLKYFVRVLNWRTWEPILVVIMTWCDPRPWILEQRHCAGLPFFLLLAEGMCYARDVWWLAAYEITIVHIWWIKFNYLIRSTLIDLDWSRFAYM